MRTLQEQWLSYAKEVLPDEVPSVQVRECCLAFYAGAKAAERIFLSAAEDRMSDEAGVAILEGMKDELQRFLEKVVKGI